MEKISGLRPVKRSAGQWSSHATPSTHAPGLRITFQSSVMSAALIITAGMECVNNAIRACGLIISSATSTQSGP